MVAKLEGDRHAECKLSRVVTKAQGDEYASSCRSMGMVGCEVTGR